MFSKPEMSPCLRCSSLGPKYKKSSICKECAKQNSKERRTQRKLEDPEWYAKERTRLKQWHEDHPGSNNKREHRKGDFLPKAHWNAILEGFDYKCAYCDAVGDLERDHVVPYSEGGLMRLGNVVPACPDCNGYHGKHNKDMREWLNDEMRYEAILTTMGDIEYASA